MSFSPRLLRRARTIFVALLLLGSGLSIDRASAQEASSSLDPIAPPQYAYGGYTEDAAWRDAAQDRIEQHRKAPLEVTVLDADGTPVDGAFVDVAMTEHAFNFGTAVSDGLINDDGTYRDHLRADVNYATIETGLKLYNWENNPGRQQSVRDAVSWLNSNDFAVRGHAAWWERWWWMNMDENSDDYWRDMSPLEIHQTVQDKIEPRLDEFEGQFRDWDAQNHPLHRRDIRPEVAEGTDMSQAEVVADWWETAHSADATAHMGINEQNILQKYPGSDWVGWYHDWITTLFNEGVNVDQIGFMGHANIARLEGIPEVLSLLDQFGEFGVPLYVSEFHITLDNWRNKTWGEASQAEKDAQAAYLRDFMTAVFSHPSVETFVHWTYWEGLAWRQTSALYGPDWTRRDHGQEYREWVYGRWWTETSGQTNAQGTYSTRGFKGDYEVAVSQGGRTRVVPATLPDGGTSLEVSGIPPLYGSEQAIAFTSGFDFVRLDNADRLNTNGPYETRTVDLWFKAEETTGGPQVLYEEGGGWTGLNIFLEEGELHAGAWNGQGGSNPHPSWATWFSTDEVEAGTWHHVALVFDAPSNTLRAYLDGTLFGSGSPGGKLATHEGRTGIGNRAGNTNFGNGWTDEGAPFEGRIDQVRIWDVGLDRAPVRRGMRRTLANPLATGGLIAAFRFGGGVMDSAHNLDATYLGPSNPQYVASGAALGQQSEVVSSGLGGVGSVTVDVSASGDDAVQVYQFGDPNGEIRSVSSGAAESRLNLVWGLGTIGSSASADVTLDFSGAEGVNDPADVVLLRRSGPEDAWTDVTSDWTREGRTFTKDGVSRSGEYAVGGARTDLPVELTGFRGTRTEDGVTLTWQTSSETNNARFVVERVGEWASGGEGESGEKSWTQIGSVKGAGTTETPQSYRFTDDDLPFEADVLRYRLTQVDLDGTMHRSGTVTVRRDAVANLQLLKTAPNPARDQVTVRFAVPSRPQGTRVTLQLYDTLGRQVRSVQGGMGTGRHARQIDLSGLTSGVYFLRLEYGGQVRSQKVTVTR